MSSKTFYYLLSIIGGILLLYYLWPVFVAVFLLFAGWLLWVGYKARKLYRTAENEYNENRYEDAGEGVPEIIEAEYKEEEIK